VVCTVYVAALHVITGKWEAISITENAILRLKEMPKRI